jgi:hypothetical protein
MTTLVSGWIALYLSFRMVVIWCFEKELILQQIVPLYLRDDG